MVLPVDVTEIVVVNNCLQIYGSTVLVEDIQDFVRNQRLNSMDLTLLQENTKVYVIKKYGNDFYVRNVEGIQFLVESEFNQKNRRRSSKFDMVSHLYDTVRYAAY